MKEIILNTVKKTSPNYCKYIALVDDEDFERVSEHNWSVWVTPTVKYAQGTINNKTILLHEFIMNDTFIDHTNHDGLDNRKINLRKATPSQNGINRRPYANKSSAFKGVSYDKKSGKWYAYIQQNQKSKSIGRFVSETKAAEAYNHMAQKLFGEFAYLNKL